MPTGVTSTESNGRTKKSPRIGLLNQLYKLEKEYLAVEEKLNSPWCSSTAKCKEGYGEQAEIRKKIIEIIKELDNL